MVSTIWSYAELVNNFDFENFGIVLYIWLGKEVMNKLRKDPILMIKHINIKMQEVQQISRKDIEIGNKVIR